MNSQWQRTPPPRPHIARVYIWLGVLVAIAALMWTLFHFFPEVTPSDTDSAWAVQAVGIAALLSACLIFSGRVGWTLRWRTRRVLPFALIDPSEFRASRCVHDLLHSNQIAV